MLMIPCTMVAQFEGESSIIETLYLQVHINSPVSLTVEKMKLTGCLKPYLKKEHPEKTNWRN